MNAMLEPRMLAASTHRPLPTQDGTEAPARISVSSHGSLPMLAMVYSEPPRQSMPRHLSILDAIAGAAQRHRFGQSREPFPIRARSRVARIGVAIQMVQTKYHKWILR